MKSNILLAFFSAFGTVLAIAGGAMMGELVKGETNTTYILITGACLFFGGLFGGLSIRD